MPITVKNALATVRHALSGADISADLDAIGVLNRAGEHLASMHTWKWLERKATLNLTDGQAYVDLPTNLRTLTAIQSPLGVNAGGGAAGVQLTTVQQLVDRRNDALSSQPYQSKYLAAIIANAAASGLVDWRLELWPTPSVDSGGETIDIFYRAGWKEIDNDSITVADLPTFCEELYLQIVRAFAKGIEAGEVVSLDAQLESIARGTLFRAAVMRDGGVQANYGPVTNGAISRGNMMPEFLSGVVDAPS